MRIAILVSLAMLFLLVEVQGFHLKHGILSVGYQKIHEEKKSELIEVEASGGEDVQCKDGDCFSGRSRKLLTDTPLTTSTLSTTKIVKNEGTKTNDQSSQRLKGDKTEHRDVAPERYPDIIDIAGMDYSTAKRKSPIHN